MDKFEMIKQFKDLLDNGIITKEEFDQKKAELLGVGVKMQMPGVPSGNDGTSLAVDQQEKTVTEKESLNEDKKEHINVITPNEESKTNVIANEIGEQPVGTHLESTPEQKSASKRGAILVGVIGFIFVFFIMIAIFGASGSGGIKGSWNCSSVVYLGEKLDANEAQADDYTLKFTDSTFEAYIYEEEISGTYEYTDTMTLDDGMEVDIYTLTADGGTELTVVHYKSENVLTLSPFGSVSSSTFIEFKKR